MDNDYNDINDWINTKCGYNHLTMTYRIDPLNTSGKLNEIVTAFTNGDLSKASMLIGNYETNEAIEALQ